MNFSINVTEAAVKTADLITFTEEIPTGKLGFLGSIWLSVCDLKMLD